jgi:glycosyltransferase involved in cell wall biosynthesis
MPVKVVATVISDLVTDQRVHKVCTTLQDNGYEVYLIGAKKKNSLSLTPRTYKASRITMLFQKKMWFYAEFNIRLFFKLLFIKADIFLGNDLDVMPATWLVAKLKNKVIVYDTHEYFLGMPQLYGKPFALKVWTKIEQTIFPTLKHIYTICPSFCEMYKRDYGKDLLSVRNVPYKNLVSSGFYKDQIEAIYKKIPDNKRILIFQGIGINLERGGEELVLAMRYLSASTYHLLIVGGGEVFDKVISLTKEKQLQDRITILPRVPFEVLRLITIKAQLGLSLDKPNNINHLYGLPNKIFDYLHSGVPVLVSRLIELERIVDSYNVGMYIDDHDPKHIAIKIEEAFADEERMILWKKNTVRLRDELNWEEEEKIVLQVFADAKKELTPNQ